MSFLPGGSLPFIDIPLHEVVNQTVELPRSWDSGALLKQRLLDARSPSDELDALELTLLQNLQRPDRVDPVFVTACRRLAAGHSIQSVRSELDVSATRLIALFRRHGGLAPKLYSRLARFQRVLRSMGASPDWAQIAALHGFSDQAHLIREFRALTTTTPRRYQLLAPADRNHLPLDARDENFLQYKPE